MQARDVRVESERREKKKCKSNCCASFANFCDKDFFKSVINLGEIFRPVTTQKVLWWCGTSLALGGCITAEVLTGAFTTAATYESYVVMGLLYAVDPVVQAINILTAKYPPVILPPVRIENNQIYPAHHSPDEFVVIDLGEDNSQIALVIPTHLAADKIAVTLRSCLKHVKPEQIFIVDNGNSENPLDETREIVRNVSPQINYLWGHLGNKSFAQYIGSLCAENYKYIFTMDDDMRLPDNFSFGTELINEKVKAVCYPILAVHPNPAKTNILTRWQSLEYKLSDCAKLSQARFGGVLYPHGAASMWETKVLLQALKLHDAIFFAEDIKLGMILKNLGYSMSIVAGACLDTEAPTSLFGPAPNLYQQRVRSWEMGRQVYFHKFLLQLLTVAPPSKSPVDFLLYKLAEAYAVYTNIADWWRFPLFLIMILNPSFWIRFAVVVAASNIPVLLWNYIKLPINHRQDLQSGFFDILSFPVFKLLESALSIGGIARLLAVYGPNYRHKPTVLEYEQSMLSDRSGLITHINEQQVRVDPPLTYKKVMYARFFQPAINIEEIEENFDREVYDVFQQAVEVSLDEGLQPDRESLAWQFESSTAYV